MIYVSEVVCSKLKECQFESKGQSSDHRTSQERNPSPKIHSPLSFIFLHMNRGDVPTSFVMGSEANLKYKKRGVLQQ